MQSKKAEKGAGGISGPFVGTDGRAARPYHAQTYLPVVAPDPAGRAARPYHAQTYLPVVAPDPAGRAARPYRARTYRAQTYPATDSTELVSGKRLEDSS